MASLNPDTHSLDTVFEEQATCSGVSSLIAYEGIGKGGGVRKGEQDSQGLSWAQRPPLT